MHNNFKKTIMSLSLILTIGLLPKPVHAAPTTTTETNNVQVALTNYLISIKNQDIESFTVDDRQLQQDNSTILFANVKFKNNEVDYIPFRVSKDNGTYKVKINADLPVKDQFKVLEQGTKIKVKTDSISPASYSRKATWNFLLSSSDPYGHDTQYSSSFSTTVGSYLKLNLRQWSNYTTASIQYALVKRGLFSDHVYNSININGNNPDSGRQCSLYVSQSSYQLRVSNQNVDFPTDSYGEVYD
ncbi:hypothetical protein AGR56_11550 [Clostridium sp. DMHC 10]|uniref:hypothetical protein n=1 Tax=Clostridium sp. DMHC 10 TaxID=747377 RepID=UPI00069EA8DC|nr:hypothetical protein [Clostridium sp. DMHC 10]KOF57142.1 hypothetical protein AGR56_11550 [Clostridium sp. DMHC 10]